MYFSDWNKRGKPLFLFLFSTKVFSSLIFRFFFYIMVSDISVHSILVARTFFTLTHWSSVPRIYQITITKCRKYNNIRTQYSVSSVSFFTNISLRLRVFWQIIFVVVSFLFYMKYVWKFLFIRMKKKKRNQIIKKINFECYRIYHCSNCVHFKLRNDDLFKISPIFYL